MSDKFRIDPGPLTSISAFYKWTVKPLHILSDLIREGNDVDIEWDLRSVEFKRINFAALATFLSTAYRVRSYVSNTPLLLLVWNPRILGFLYDISFISIVKEFDICNFQEGMIGGFESGTINPNTELIVFPYKDSPNYQLDATAWQSWKDDQRMQITKVLLKKTSKIFDSRSNKTGLPNNSKNLIATSTAELILNSILWGKSTAFVGMQRSGKRISIVVADSGQGFLRSLYDNTSKSKGINISTHSDALVFASMTNNRDFGLKKVINMITENGGWVEMSSYSSEIRWSSPSWGAANKSFEEVLGNSLDMPGLIEKVFETPISNAKYEQKQKGYYRNWSRGIRGARISFELPLNQEKF